MTHPRFNHVAMSVAPSLLEGDGRTDILRFYGTVFGWEEMPTMTKPGEQLVLQAYSYDQFVFIVGEDEPMSAPRMDHFGMSVGTMAEFEDYLGRARAFAGEDDRVDVIDRAVDDFEFLRLHNFYVGYLLPMMVEVQHWDWAENAGPTPPGSS